MTEAAEPLQEADREDASLVARQELDISERILLLIII